MGTRLAVCLVGIVAAVIMGGTEPLAGGTIYYEEDFDGLSSLPPEITVHSGAWAVTGDKLVASSGGDSMIWIEGIPWDDVRIETEFSIANSSTGNFTVWINAIPCAPGEYHAYNKGYEINFSPAGADDDDNYIHRVDGIATSTELASTPSNLAATTQYLVAIERTGDITSIFLHDGSDYQPYLTAIPDSTYSGGKIGFRFWDGGTVDDVLVVPEPATLSLLAIGGLAVLRRRRMR